MKPTSLLLTAGLVTTQLYAADGDLTMALGGFNVGKSGSTAMG